MTIANTNIVAGPYNGNGATTQFPYTWRITNASQVIVVETAPDGVVTVLTLDTHYSVDGIGNDDGGMVTRLGGPLLNGAQWYIRANFPLTQLTDLQNQGGFFPEVHEDAFDKLTRVAQQQDDQINRSLRFRDSYSGGVQPKLDPPVAGQFLRWNEEADGVTSSEGTGGTGSNPNANETYDIIADSSVIRDGVGTITVRAFTIFNGVFQPVTSGSIQLYANGLLVTEANGFAAGSDGFIGVFDADDIDGDVTVQLRDGPAGTIYDDRTLSDIADANPNPVVVVTADNKRVFSQAPDQGAWDETITTLTFEVIQGGATIASATVAVMLDTDAVALSAIETPHPDINISLQGVGGISLTALARHIPSNASESEQVIAIPSTPAGAVGYIAQLSNPTVTVDALNDGTGFDLVPAQGRFEITQGGLNVSGSAIFSVLNPATIDGLTMAIDGVGNYSLSGPWISDGAAFTLRCEIDGQTFDRPYTIAKARAGANGGAGAQPKVARPVQFSNGNSWARDTLGAWEPLTLFTLSTHQWTQGANVDGSLVLRWTLDASTGNITVTQEGAATGGATFSVNPGTNGTTAPSIVALCGGIPSGATVTSTQSGNNGADGISGLVEGIGVGAVGNLTFTRNSPANNQLRIAGDVVFLKNGTRVDISGGFDDIVLPPVALSPFYICVGTNTALARLGPGFPAHNAFACTNVPSTGAWSGIGSGGQVVPFTPTATDTLIAIGRKSSASILSLSSYVNPMNLAADNISSFIQNGAIVNALIQSLSADKISAGSLVANIAMLGELALASTGRINIDTGSSKLTIGAGFGSSNQFVVWWGPSVAESLMTESNATFYLRTDGSAFFGGNLSAGALSANGATADTANDAELIVGPFGTNGGTKTLVVSYEYFNNGLFTSNPPGNNGDPISAVLVLDRRLGGDSNPWVTINTFNYNGTYNEFEEDFIPGATHSANESINGSSTVPDNNGSLQNFEYRLRLTRTSFIGTSTNLRQRIALQVTEP